MFRQRYLVSLLLLLLTGCSIYDDEYHYVPRPVLAGIPPTAPSSTKEHSRPPVSVLASIVGVRNSDDKSGIPACVEARLQLNNDGLETVTFDPRTLQLSDAALARLDPPILRPEQDVSVEPSQSTSVTAYFPFPPGRHASDMDLDRLQLRWTLKVGERSVSQTVLFRRPTTIYYQPYYYYGPYWYGPYAPYPVWHGGVVVVHRNQW